MRAAVPRAPHQPVVGARPDQPVRRARGRQAVDHAPPRLDHVDVRRGRRVQGGGDGRVGPRQVRADRRPPLAAVCGAEYALVAEVEGVVARAEHQRQRPGAAVVVGEGQGGVDAAGLSALEVQLVDAAAEHGVGVVGVGGDVVALAAGGDLVELGHVHAVDRARTAGHARRARVLLGAVDAVGKAAVGDHVVELARRLVEPARPGPAAVQRHQRSLVHAQDAAVGIVGIDPQAVEVVARGVALDRQEGGAAVLRAQDDGVAHPHLVGVLRVGGELAEVPAALPDARVAAGLAPARPVVVGAVEPARLGVDQGVHPVRRGGGDGQADPPRRVRQAAARDRRPGAAPVVGLVEPAPRSVGGRVDVPRRPSRLPQGGVDGVGVAGLELQVDGARVGVLEQHARPAGAPVGGAEHSALRVGSVGVAQGGDEQHLGVARVHQYAGDLARVGKPDGGPVRAAVGGAEHAHALRDVRAHVGFARAHVERGRRGRGDGYGADGAHGRRVEDRVPGAAGVARLPHPAVDRAEVEALRVVRRARHRQHPAAAERADRTPAQGLEQGRLRALGRRQRRQRHPLRAALRGLALRRFGMGDPGGSSARGQT